MPAQTGGKVLRSDYTDVGPRLGNDLSHSGGDFVYLGDQAPAGYSPDWVGRGPHPSSRFAVRSWSRGRLESPPGYRCASGSLSHLSLFAFLAPGEGFKECHDLAQSALPVLLLRPSPGLPGLEAVVAV